MVEFTKTLTWSDESEINISRTVSLHNVEADFENARYDFDVYLYKGQSGMPEIGSFKATVDPENKQFALPRSFLKESNLKPGQTVKFVGETIDDEKSNGGNDFVDSAAVLDRITPHKDSSNSDGISSSLNSETVVEHIGDSKVRLRFRNTRNGKAAELMVMAYDSSKSRFQFPYDVRRAIDAESTDVIEISEPTSTEKVSERLETLENTISDMEGMVSELYDAYKNNG